MHCALPAEGDVGEKGIVKSCPSPPHPMKTIAADEYGIWARFLAGSIAEDAAVALRVRFRL